MDVQTAAIVLQFLSRAQLTGAEVDAFVQARAAVQAVGQAAMDAARQPQSVGAAAAHLAREAAAADPGQVIYPAKPLAVVG